MEKRASGPPKQRKSPQDFNAIGIVSRETRRRFSPFGITPGSVKYPLFAHPLEAMGAEEIALGLDEIGGAACPAIAVEIGKSRRQCRHRRSCQGGAGHDAPQRSWASCIMVTKCRRHQQIGEALRSAKAVAMVSRNCERMMQPARQMRAMVAIGRFQVNSFEAASSTAKPCA